MLGTCWSCESMTYPDGDGNCPDCGSVVDQGQDPAWMGDPTATPENYPGFWEGEGE
jgi:hypothetical protein